MLSSRIVVRSENFIMKDFKILWTSRFYCVSSTWVFLNLRTILPRIKSMFLSRCNILRLFLSWIAFDLQFSATLKLLISLSVSCFYGFYYFTESTARINRDIILSSVEKKSYCWTAMICCYISNNSICYCEFHSKTCKSVSFYLIVRDKLAYKQS